MSGVNKVILIGNLGSDPECRTMSNGEFVANLSLATSEAWNDKSTGEKREVTEWHRVVFYRRLADIAGQYLRKGSKIYVEGKLKTRKWQDQNGVERYITEIIGESLTMLSSANNGTQGQQTAPPAQTNKAPVKKPVNQYAKEKGKPQPDTQQFDDDIPF